MEILKFAMDKVNYIEKNVARVGKCWEILFYE